jgi:hypothetical protein
LHHADILIMPNPNKLKWVRGHYIYDDDIAEEPTPIWRLRRSYDVARDWSIVSNIKQGIRAIEVCDDAIDKMIGVR